MKTTNLFRMVAMFVLAIAGALSASAAGALTVSRTAMTSDGNLNYQNFEVQATTAGTHYADFWLCPAHSAKDGYTKYGVYVNGELIGTITPDKSGWQAIRLDGDASIQLKNGQNIISVATKAPKIPYVERICIADNKEDANIDHTAYDEFFANAKLGIITEPKQSYEMPLSFASNATNAASMVMRTSQTLRYTAMKYIYFVKDDIASITFTSEVPHISDAVLAGYGAIKIPYEDTSNNAEFPQSISSNGGIGGIGGGDIEYVDPNKFWIMHAESEDMQQYNYHKESQARKGHQESTIKFVVPETGYYLVRVTTTANDIVSVADIDVSDGDYYEPEPISCTKFDCVIPADGNEYLSFTNCYDQENDDPIIYVHGQNGNIVGFDDDCAGKWRSRYDLCNHDAAIVQQYKQATTAISVSSYSTDNPVSKCTVLARIPLAETYSSPSRTSDENNSVEFPKAVTIGSNIEIISDDVIKHLSAHNVYGTPVGRVDANDTQLDIPTASLNLNKTGLYILTVETVSGVESARILVK